jgi:hypothetical protein
MKKESIKLENRAQLDISFGFIFGIIVIIAVVAISIYVIVHFINLSNCTQTGNFYSDLQDEIDKAWSGSMTSKVFTESLPSGVKSICFGTLDKTPTSDSRTQYQSLLRFKALDKNSFIYPYSKACNVQLANHQFEHVNIDRFFCSDVIKGKASVKISKNVTDALVTLSR